MIYGIILEYGNNDKKYHLKGHLKSPDHKEEFTYWELKQLIEKHKICKKCFEKIIQVSSEKQRELQEIYQVEQERIEYIQDKYEMNWREHEDYIDEVEVGY